MNRVWKHFLKNLAWPVGAATYLFSVITGSTYIETLYEGGGLLVVVLFIALPVAVYLIRGMWLDAKRKVEWENEDMLRSLKGK
jgi:hypothetical protein